MADEKSKSRKRMVVEEVGAPETEKGEEASTEPVTEIKEKVEELQGITDHMGDDIEKSAEVQEEIAEAAEKVEPPQPSHTPPTDFTPSYDRPKNGPNPLFILIPGVLLLGALLGGVYFYQKQLNANPTPTPSPEATIEDNSTPGPSASPSAKLDLTKYPINVQNGSGIPGTAGSVKDTLTKAGFKVSSTGNADNYDYTDTIIKVKSDVPAEFVTKLTTTLSGVYSVAKAQTLPDSSKDEVVVIVGSSKAQ